MKKYPGGLIFVRFGWSYEGSMPILIFDESLGYAYSLCFKQFPIKLTFEPITHTLKWVLADAACKVNTIFFNIASGLCWEMPNGVKFLFLIWVLDFRDFE